MAQHVHKLQIPIIYLLVIMSIVVTIPSSPCHSWYASKFGIPTASSSCVGIMKVDRLLKYMASMTNVCANMVLPTCGSYSPICSITSPSRPWSSIPSFVSTEDYLHRLTPSITSVNWTVSRKSLMRVRCVICFGVIPTIAVDGASRRAVQDLPLDRTYHNNSMIGMASHWSVVLIN